MQLHETGASRRTLIIMAVVAAVLQVAVAPQIEIAGGRMNFMVVLAIVLALTSDISTAVCIGFFCGLFFDLTSSMPIGLLSLLLTLTSFVVAALSRSSLNGFSPDSLRVCAVAIVGVNLLYSLVLLFMGVETSFLWSVFGHGFVSSALDLAVSVPFLLAMGSGSGQRGFSMRSSGLRHKKPTKLR